MSSDSVSINPDWQSLAMPELRAVLHNLQDDILEDMKRRVPVETGKLKESLSVEAEVGETFADCKLTAKADADYAPFVELGTEFQPAQPFMRPSVEREWTLRA